MDRETLRAAIAAGLRFDYLLFDTYTARGDGDLGPECLSHWYPAGFQVHGVFYPTAAHFVMAAKARLFGDDHTLEHILRAHDMADAKRIVVEIRDSERPVWEQHRFDIAVAANFAKFDQSKSLAEFLLSTGDRVLVDASPRDRECGIGMGKSNPNARNPSKWRGHNVLGFALMKVRDVLRESR